MKNKTGAVATQRLFFALWPEAEMQQRLAKAAEALLPTGTGRLVRPENLHCTLVFLGSVDADQRVCVEAVADQVRAGAFNLHLDRFGFFRRPQVGWLGCTTTPVALHRLVGELAQGCAACGFPPEHRPYEVHLTIVRKVTRDPGRPPFMALDWPVDRFALVESVNEEGGVRYRPLRSWKLRAK
jgi:2'-5' RNA ligase